MRFGTAMSALVRDQLNAQQIQYQMGGLYTAQDSAANDLRSGKCDGFLQPLMMAQDMLIRGSNKPCDLRLVYPPIMCEQASNLGRSFTH
jgi:hypothetical protein